MERRIRWVCIDEREVFDWFVNASKSWSSGCRAIDLPMLADTLPKDFLVIEVRHEPRQKAFLFLVESETFSPVEPGSMIPDISTAMRYEGVELARHGGKLIIRDLPLDYVDGRFRGGPGVVVVTHPNGDVEISACHNEPELVSYSKVWAEAGFIRGDGMICNFIDGKWIETGRKWCS